MAGKKVVYLSDLMPGVKFPRNKLQGVYQVGCAKTPLGLLEAYRYKNYVIITLDGVIAGKEMFSDWAIKNAYRYLKNFYDKEFVWRYLRMLSWAISENTCFDYRSFEYNVYSLD